MLVIGSYNRDTVLRVARFPKPGETLAATGMDRFHGGKGSNQAVAAARAGAEVTFAAAVGADAAGVAARDLWAAEGIAPAPIPPRDGTPTGEALILLDAAGENEIVIVAGANGTLTPMEALAGLPGAAIVLAQLETPVEATLAAFEAARRAGARTLLNAAPAQTLPPALLAATDILIVNETEAERLAGRGGTPEALAAVLLPLVAEGVVLTAGATGAHWAGRDGSRLHAAPPPVSVRDSTGAGDAFTGAFAAALAEGMGIPAALRRGVVAGALACRVLGAVPSLPRRAEILAAGG
ncbi:ribokinase [Roseomonas sp. PWR1]|uniref:Ribokinase n=1 Tax=Roseomonas nitratireducens TaxID=2820810 RepID=A0ABS4AN26_9PROT|nr:ribokinase [Neoroseomonas nitratireducens]